MRSLLWILILGLSTFGCLVPEAPEVADRDRLALEMPHLAAYEARRGRLRDAIGAMGAGGLLDGLDADTLAKIKEARDIEYVYYHAAVVALAAGRFARCRAYVALAQKELDRITELLREYLRGLTLKVPGSSTF